MTRRASGFKLTLMAALTAVGFWGCDTPSPQTTDPGNTGPTASPSNFQGADETSENLAQLATPCTFVVDSGVVTISMSAGEYALVGRSDGGAILVNGTACSTATSANATRININGSPDGGNETVILDYLNGAFALGTAASAGVSVDLKGGTDALKVRASGGADTFYVGTVAPDAGTTGTYALAVGIGGAPTGIKNVTFTNVESLVISTGPGDDTLRNSFPDAGGSGTIVYGRSTTDAGPTLTFYGGDNNDTLNISTAKASSPVTYYGGDGIDTIDLSSRTADLTITLGTNGHCESTEICNIMSDVEGVRGGSGNDTFVCADVVDSGCVIYGGAGNDTITGSSGDDTLYGEAGNDVIIPGEGNDTVDCSAGNDTVSYADRHDDGGTVGVIVVLGDAGVATTGNGNSTLTEGDSVAACENVIGTAGADSIFGNEYDNVITGGAGDDFLYGGGGNDTFVMAATPALNGNDTIDGQGGTEDTVDFSARTTDVTVVLDGGSQTDYNGEEPNDGGTAENIHLLSVENVLTGSGNDSVSGDAEANRLECGGGNDTISGGDGDDTIDPGAGTNTITCGPGNDIVVPGGGTDTRDGTCEL